MLVHHLSRPGWGGLMRACGMNHDTLQVGFAALRKIHRESGSARFTADVLKLVPDLEGSVYEMAHTKRVLTVRQQGIDFNCSRDDD